MLQIITYIRFVSGKPLLVNQNNQPGAAAPSLYRGGRYEHIIRPLNADGTPFTFSDLPFVAWEYGIAQDFDTATPILIAADNAAITVSSYTVDGNEYAQISIPILDTNTNELIADLATDPFKLYGCELLGFIAGEERPDLIWQYDFTVRNRRMLPGTGSPAPLPDGNYTAIQVDALIRAGNELQFSTDDIAYHSTQTAADLYYQYRYPGGDWSNSIAMIVGPDGVKGDTGPAGADGTSITVKGSDSYANIIAITGAAAGDLWISTTTNASPAVAIGDGIVSDGADNWTNAGAIQGPQGDTGAKGDTGDTGPQGDTGVKGDTGDAGPAGADGADGAPGTDGTDVFVYVAYSSDNAGTDWSLTPSDILKYRSEVHSITALTPVESDFAAATWIKYLGDAGAEGTSITVKGSDSYANIVAITGAAAGDLWISTTTNASPAVAIGDGIVSDGADNWTNVGAIQGPQGDAGAKGDTGDTGPQGDTGVKGDTGDAGPAGADGADGADGAPGTDGTDAFVYVAYASDNTGTGWTLTPSDNLKYRAEIHSTTALAPVESDFAAATWLKYLGDDGADGTGTSGIDIQSVWAFNA